MKALAAMWILLLMEFLVIDLYLIFKVDMLDVAIVLAALSIWITYHKSFWSRHGIDYLEETWLLNAN